MAAAGERPQVHDRVRKRGRLASRLRISVNVSDTKPNCSLCLYGSASDVRLRDSISRRRRSQSRGSIWARGKRALAHRRVGRPCGNILWISPTVSAPADRRRPCDAGALGTRCFDRRCDRCRPGDRGDKSKTFPRPGADRPDHTRDPFGSCFRGLTAIGETRLFGDADPFRGARGGCSCLLLGCASLIRSGLLRMACRRLKEISSTDFCEGLRSKWRGPSSLDRRKKLAGLMPTQGLIGARPSCTLFRKALTLESRGTAGPK